MAVKVLVTPGPAVTAATPTEPLSREKASAQNAAFSSARTSMIRMPLRLASTNMGEMCPPHNVKRCENALLLKHFCHLSPTIHVFLPVPIHCIPSPQVKPVRCCSAALINENSPNHTKAYSVVVNFFRSAEECLNE